MAFYTKNITHQTKLPLSRLLSDRTQCKVNHPYPLGHKCSQNHSKTLNVILIAVIRFRLTRYLIWKKIECYMKCPTYRSTIASSDFPFAHFIFLAHTLKLIKQSLDSRQQSRIFFTPRHLRRGTFPKQLGAFLRTLINRALNQARWIMLEYI